MAGGCCRFPRTWSSRRGAVGPRTRAGRPDTKPLPWRLSDEARSDRGAAADGLYDRPTTFGDLMSELYCCVETPKGSQLARGNALQHAIQCPFDCGYFPQTTTRPGLPLEAIVCAQRPTRAGGRSRSSRSRCCARTIRSAMARSSCAWRSTIPLGARWTVSVISLHNCEVRSNGSSPPAPLLATRRQSSAGARATMR